MEQNENVYDLKSCNNMRHKDKSVITHAEHYDVMYRSISNLGSVCHALKRTWNKGWFIGSETKWHTFDAIILTQHYTLRFSKA